MIPWANNVGCAAAQLSAEIVKRIRTARPLPSADKQTPTDSSYFVSEHSSRWKPEVGANRHAFLS